ncbi:MAG: hypothetical protein ACKOC1_09265 [Hyphomicrobiales bacterium]
MFGFKKKTSSGNTPRTSKPHRAAIFMHLFKVGGTSVHHAIATSLTESGICPVRQEDFAWSLMALRVRSHQFLPYRFVSGHFDIRRTRLLKEAGYGSFTQLREPLARIASVYNFLRAHSAERHPKLRELTPFSRLIFAAKEMPIDRFFGSEICRQSISLNNHYVHALATPDDGLGMALRDDEIERLKFKALDNLAVFDGVGFLDTQRQLVNALRKSLALPNVTSVAAMKQTSDEMTWHEWMEPVAIISGHTLKPYVADLISGDQFVYDAARERFFANDKFQKAG